MILFYAKYLHFLLEKGFLLKKHHARAYKHFVKKLSIVMPKLKTVAL